MRGVTGGGGRCSYVDIQASAGKRGQTPADKASCQHSSGMTNERERGLKDTKRKKKNPNNFTLGC